MRVRYLPKNFQHIGCAARSFVLLFGIFVFFGCKRSSEELPVVPPLTHPLTREYIGFGVVNVSFTHLLSETGAAGVSQGYLRRGTVVRIVERVQVNNRGRIESWVMAESNYGETSQGFGGISQGWLQETVLVIYDNESQASTAARTMSQ